MKKILGISLLLGSITLGLAGWYWGLLLFIAVLAVPKIVILLFDAFFKWRRTVKAKKFIQGYAFPAGVIEKLCEKRPDLSPKDCELVGKALQQFFCAYLKSGGKYVSMPSQAADDLWHALILDTQAYDQFCRQAFGRFLHHIPATALERSLWAVPGCSIRETNAGLRRCWRYACMEEGISPTKPVRLPLLFALDGRLGIADGFRYEIDCRGLNKVQNNTGSGNSHCVADFGSPEFDGSTDGFGYSADSDSGDSDGGDSGCGGGCGGCGGD